MFRKKIRLSVFVVLFSLQIHAVAQETKRVIPGKFINEAKVMEFLYGDYNKREKYSKRPIAKEELESFQPYAADTLNVYPLLFAPFQQNGIDRYLLLTEATPPDYGDHPSAPIIGGVLFSKVENGWQLDNEQQFITQLGSYGRAPQTKLTKIGPDKYGVLFFPGYTGQGMTVESIALYGEVGQDIRELVFIENTYWDNFGDCGKGFMYRYCCKYSSRYRFVPGKNPAYFDLVVTTIGIKGEDDCDGKPGSRKIRKFVFDQNKYKPSKS